MRPTRLGYASRCRPCTGPFRAYSDVLQNAYEEYSEREARTPAVRKKDVPAGLDVLAFARLARVRRDTGVLLPRHLNDTCASVVPQHRCDPRTTRCALAPGTSARRTKRANRGRAFFDVDQRAAQVSFALRLRLCQRPPRGGRWFWLSTIIRPWRLYAASSARSCLPSSTSSMILATNASRSSGLRLVTMP